MVRVAALLVLLSSSPDAFAQDVAFAQDMALGQDIAFAQDVAIAQDVSPFDSLFRPPETQQDPPARSEKSGPDFGFTAGLHLRYSMPFGSADQEVDFTTIGAGVIVTIDQDMSWSDLFDPGYGYELEVDIYIGKDKHGKYGRGEEMRYGFFVSASHETFGGDGVSDDFGRKMRLEDMTVGTLIVGAKMETSMGKGSFLDGRMGLGIVHYSAVEATVSGPGFEDFRAEFIEDTYTLAFDMRGHGGISLGPINLVAGLGFRLLVPPSEGGDVDMDSGFFWTFDLEIGAEIGF